MRLRSLATRAGRRHLVPVPVVPPGRVFRPSRAYNHDVERPRIDADHVAAEWALMYHWLTRDEEMAQVCGFTAADLSHAARAARIGELRREVGPHGSTFTVRPREMQFWVRFSWISADRCSGRQHTLQRAVIRHLPDVDTGPAMLRAAVEHGDLAMDAPLPPRTVVTVLGPPAPPGRPGPLFLTEQLLRAAGHRRDGGSWLGDGGYVDLADWALRTAPALVDPAPGYPPGTFDTLPMIAVGVDGNVAAGTCPARSRHLVDLPWPVHPDGGGSASPEELFGCWPAVPLQTNFDLDIAGQRYCVLFSGWYVDEEIAANLLDPQRYDWAGRVGSVALGVAGRLDEYRLAQVEIATLRAVRNGFKAARRRLNTVASSQQAFGKFHERHVATHGEPPPNDTGWTANRFGSRYRHPSHAMLHVRQTRGAALVKHWMTHRSLAPDVAVEIVDLRS
jgi:nitric oxide synthase oxygenase domain/subunit